MEVHNSSGGSEPEPKPALVINIFSWATPVVALLALVAGIALGYFGRPFITQDGSELASNMPVATSPGVASQPQTESPAVTGSDAQQSADDIMATLISQARHFKGDPQAPVTLIEFSDFK
jgi:hypothetical protein